MQNKDSLHNLMYSIASKSTTVKIKTREMIDGFYKRTSHTCLFDRSSIRYDASALVSRQQIGDASTPASTSPSNAFTDLLDAGGEKLPSWLGGEGVGADTNGVSGGDSVGVEPTSVETVSDTSIVSDPTPPSTPDTASKPEQQSEPVEHPTLENPCTSKYSLSITKRFNGDIVCTAISPSAYNGAVEIPHGVTHIEDSAFYHSDACKISIPETVVYLGDCCFAHTKITEIKLPASITIIPASCFYLSKIESINLDHILGIGQKAFLGTDLESVELGDGIIQISASAFEGCKKLKSFKHKHSIKKICYNAFNKCKLLEAIDLEGVTDIEPGAFTDTGLKSVTIPPDCKYVLNGTFSSNSLVEVNIPKGGYKLADAAFLNPQLQKDNYYKFKTTKSLDPHTLQGITYTLSKEVTNIGMKLINPWDKVKCYHNSIAEKVAISCRAKIEYLDEQPQQKANAIDKGVMMGMSLKDIVVDSIKRVYDNEDTDFEFTYPSSTSSRIISRPLTDAELQYLSIPSLKLPSNSEDAPVKEHGKYRVLVNHFLSTSDNYLEPLESKFTTIKQTFNTTSAALYEDGTSRIYKVTFHDNRFESLKSNYIVALTGNTLQCAIKENTNTDIYCTTHLSKDMKRLVSILRVGDVLGETVQIGGNTVENAWHYHTVVNANTGKRLSVKANLFQAIHQSGITIKSSKNTIYMILPINNLILKCSTIGKSVWLNENEDSHKERSCFIEDIHQYDTNTYFSKAAANTQKNCELFNKISRLTTAERITRASRYSTIQPAEITPYLRLRKLYSSGKVNTIRDMNTYEAQTLLSLPIIEEKSNDWLDKSSGKTIVSDSVSKLVLRDNGYILQYKTMKRTQMYNKLLVGGNNTMYAFDLHASNGERLGVYVSNRDLSTIFDNTSDMLNSEPIKAFRNESSLSRISIDKSRIFEVKESFDFCDTTEFIYISSLFNPRPSDPKIKPDDYGLYLSVYKPNGLYYIVGIMSKNMGRKYAIPLIQVGDMEVVEDFIGEIQTQSNNYSKILTNVLSVIYYRLSYPERNLQQFLAYSRRSSALKSYEQILAARDLCIDGETRFEVYKSTTHLPPILINMYGIDTTHGDTYSPTYTPPSISEIIKTRRETTRKRTRTTGAGTGAGAGATASAKNPTASQKPADSKKSGASLITNIKGSALGQAAKSKSKDVYMFDSSWDTVLSDDIDDADGFDELTDDDFADFV